MQIGASQKTSASPKTLPLLIFEPRQALESALKSAKECSLRAECALFACKTKLVHGRGASRFPFSDPSVFQLFQLCVGFFATRCGSLCVFSRVLVERETKRVRGFRRFANVGSKLKSADWLCLDVRGFDGVDSRMSVVLVKLKRHLLRMLRLLVSDMLKDFFLISIW